jgi:hypothetical protein
METWREHAFKVGIHYEATEDVINSICRIAKGEELIFDHSTYSAYDGSTGYVFKTKGGEIKTVFVDDEEEDRASGIFVAKL